MLCCRYVFGALWQVVDEVKGPVTRKDYEIYHSPAGETLFGKVVNAVGFERMPGSDAAVSGGPVGFDKSRPLINAQVNMNAREQITECLLTGIKVRPMRKQPRWKGVN